MIGTSKQAPLPLVTFPARKGRGAAAGHPGFELVFVKATVKEALGDAFSSATQTLGMKMESNSSMSLDTLYGTVIEALVQAGLLEDRLYFEAGPATRVRSRLLNVRKRILLAFKQPVPRRFRNDGGHATSVSDLKLIISIPSSVANLAPATFVSRLCFHAANMSDSRQKSSVFLKAQAAK